MTETYNPTTAMINAMAADVNIPATAQLELLNWYTALNLFKDNTPVVQAGWQALLAEQAQSQTPWLTADLQAYILNYAFRYGVQLVSQ
jgi:hypothetical protein